MTQRTDVKPYTILTFAMDNARNNDEIFIGIAGGWDRLSVIGTSNLGSTFNIRFPDRTSPLINLADVRNIKLLEGLKLDRIFVTHPAVSGGSITILFGGEGGVEVSSGDTVTVISMPTTDINWITVASGWRNDFNRQLGSVRDHWLNEIIDNDGFFFWGQEGAGVGVFSHLQILNPAASGANVVIRELWVRGETVNNPISFRRHDTALLTSDAQTLINNLDLGGVAVQTQIRRESLGALQGTELGRMMVITTEDRLFSQLWNFRLGPGEGLVLAPLNSNEGLQIRGFLHEE